MKIIFLSFFLFALSVQAKIKNINDILSKATPEEMQNLPEILQETRLVPVKDSPLGKSIFRVMEVKSGSVFERQGIKAGDLIRWSKAGSSTQNLEIHSTLRPPDKAKSSN